MKTLLPEDIEIVRAQIGREPRGMHSVVVRNAENQPAVVKVLPYDDGDPFPTLYWLTCPKLSKQISSLEGQGRIKELENLLRTDMELCKQHIADHNHYHAERNNFLIEIFGVDKASQLCPQFEGRGVGGLADYKRVRCFHMFYAAHLVTPNVVGKWVEEYLA